MRYGKRKPSKDILKVYINYYRCLPSKKKKTVKENITKGIQQTNTTAYRFPFILSRSSI